MAGRPMGKLHQDDVRAKIQTSQLINRLQSHALGSLELSASQIKAIEVLIRKTLPDLQSIEHSGEIATSQPYDLSGISDEALGKLEGILGTARSVGGDSTGASASKPGSVH